MTSSIPSKDHTPQTRDRGEVLIGIFKLGKAALLLAAAIGTFSALDPNLKMAILRKMDQLGVDPGNRRIHQLIFLLGLTSRERIELAGAGSFFYAAIFATEGIGLLMAKHWARYFTTIVTASFLPLECYALYRNPDTLKSLVIAINVAIVIYLIARIRRITMQK